MHEENKKKGWNGILDVVDLKKHFGEVKAVDGLTFSVKKGEIYGLLGPNGAGKTTTIKCIMGLLSLQEGSIRVLGLDPTVSPERVKGEIGYVSEEPMLYKSMTPEELFNFIASIRKLDAEGATSKAKSLVTSLDALQYYKSAIVTLSKGNKQKMQIISALIHDPPLLIMDEPLAGLDAKTSRIVKDILKIHVEEGGSILLSTHIMEQASELCDKIGIINKGKMVAEGTLNELQSYADAAGANLEDVYLKLTEQDKDVKSVVDSLRASYHASKPSELN
ncbi:ATP-binding cassette domain-containing protein [Candidatus Bathyarchaeota archaeon]|nr:ATP-binding cassette domain-containing protein [Candidatus Bathyarchaeota archaeon]